MLFRSHAVEQSSAQTQQQLEAPRSEPTSNKSSARRKDNAEGAGGSDTARDDLHINPNEQFVTQPDGSPSGVLANNSLLSPTGEARGAINSRCGLLL